MIFTSGILKKQLMEIHETVETLSVTGVQRFIKIMCTFCEMFQ